jgi:hypothetical protein
MPCDTADGKSLRYKQWGDCFGVNATIQGPALAQEELSSLPQEGVNRPRAAPRQAKASCTRWQT